MRTIATLLKKLALLVLLIALAVLLILLSVGCAGEGGGDFVGENQTPAAKSSVALNPNTTESVLTDEPMSSDEFEAEFIAQNEVRADDALALVKEVEDAGAIDYDNSARAFVLKEEEPLGELAQRFVTISIAELNNLLASGDLNDPTSIQFSTVVELTVSSKGEGNRNGHWRYWWGLKFALDNTRTHQLLNKLNYSGNAVGAGVGAALGGPWGAVVGSLVGGLPNFVVGHYAAEGRGIWIWVFWNGTVVVRSQ